MFFKFVTLFNFEYLVETSVGSVPDLNSSVIFMLSGVYSLGNIAGFVSFSIVTSTTPSGFVKFLVPLNVPLIIALNNLTFCPEPNLLVYFEFIFS